MIINFIIGFLLETFLGRWIFILCGVSTIFSGFLNGPPILISPESTASIKGGAKTGLSTVVCGFCFLLSIFFSPIFGAIPAAGTSPTLIMIGVSFALCFFEIIAYFLITVIIHYFYYLLLYYYNYFLVGGSVSER